MGLKSMSLLTGATIGATGGTALVFADDGQTITNGVHLVVPADADYQTRRQATAKYRAPVLDAKTGAYGKDKKSISYAIPIVLTDGRVVFNTIRVEREAHPSLSAAELTDLNVIGAQLLTDADALGFWATGSTS
jgi:hypothetical protein